MYRSPHGHRWLPKVRDRSRRSGARKCLVTCDGCCGVVEHMSSTAQLTPDQKLLVAQVQRPSRFRRQLLRTIPAAERVSLTTHSMTQAIILIIRYRPQDIGLTVWVNIAETGSKELHQITALNQTVSVVEPQSSWFDLQLLFLYLVMASALAGGAYLLYSSFFAQPTRKSSKTKTRQVKAVVPAEKGKAYPDVKPYEEEWIPEQHLKHRASKLKKSGAAAGGASSGGEDVDVVSGGEATSGGETSGVEGKSKSQKKKSKKA